MKIWNHNHSKGFTLIEVIVVLVLVGVMAALLGTVIIKAVENYYFAREADHLSQKAQVALARINKELIGAKEIYSASNDVLQFENAEGEKNTIARTGVRITMQQPLLPPRTLIDGLGEYGGKKFLEFIRYDGTAWTVETGSTVHQLSVVKVILVVSLKQGETLTFEKKINPRAGNMPTLPGLN